MLNINLISVGTKMPSWVTSGYEEYAKRLSKYCRFNLIEIPLAPRSKNTNIELAKNTESNSIISKINPQDYVIALEIDGAKYSTNQFAKYLEKISLTSSHITILIGGPDGMNHECLARANAKISLSGLTLPHPLVRIILVEQLYRAFSLLENHPYHK